MVFLVKSPNVSFERVELVDFRAGVLTDELVLLLRVLLLEVLLVLLFKVVFEGLEELFGLGVSKAGVSEDDIRKEQEKAWYKGQASLGERGRVKGREPPQKHTHKHNSQEKRKRRTA